MKCDTCKKTADCVTLCEDMEKSLPKEMRFEEIPMGGVAEMENIVQRYIEECDAPIIEREISPDLFKVGIETLNKLAIKQHVIMYLYHVAGFSDKKIANFFCTSRKTIYHARKNTYRQIHRITDSGVGVDPKWHEFEVWKKPERRRT